jgi:hypothetical protein
MLSRLPSRTARLPVRASVEGETSRAVEPAGIYRQSPSLRPV